MKTPKCFFAIVCVLCSTPGAQAQPQRLQDSTLSLLGVWTTSSRAYDCVVSSSLAFVAHEQDGLSIVDVSTPADPKTVGYFPLDIGSPAIYIERDLAYLVGASPEWPNFPNYLVILDVADPSDVREVGRLDLGGYACDIQVADNYAYVLLQDGGLKIVNVENPSEPAAVALCRVLTEGQGIFVQGKYAYVAGFIGDMWGRGIDTRTARLCIISIDDPSKPMIYGLCNGSVHIYGEVYVEGSHAYVAGYSSSGSIDQGSGISFLDIIDVSSPSRPSVVCHFDTTGNYNGIVDICVSEGHIYCATGNGLEVLDGTDPSSVHRMARFKAENGRAVAVSDMLIVLLAQDGLYILQGNVPTDIGDRSASPAAFFLTQNYPNPFNPTTLISYQLPVASDVKLVVFDVLGRGVATLVDGVEEPGHKSVEWDASGLASGVYFCRLQSGAFVETKKLLLLR